MSLRQENEQLRAEVEHLRRQLALADEVGHPLRRRILEWLWARGAGSPAEFVREINDPEWSTSAVSYHFKVLAGRKPPKIQLNSVRQVRGAVEHVYQHVDAPLGRVREGAQAGRR